MAVYELHVFRYDPSIDTIPQYKEYTINTGVRLKVLDALNVVSTEFDPDVAYRASCLMGRCGSCAVMVNGRPVLACQAQLEPGRSIIEPLSGYPVIRDLVIDRTPHEQLQKTTRLYLEDSGVMRPKPFVFGRDMYALTLCTDCLVCQSACPARNEAPAEFCGPAVLAQLARYHVDPRDQGPRAHIALLEGLSSCTSCMTCSHVCPKGIDVFGEAVRKLRSSSVANGLPTPDMQKDMLELYARTRMAVPASRAKLTDEISALETGPVGVFVGCMLQGKHKAWGQALLRTAAEHKCDLAVPKEQVCCGGPLLWTGHESEAREAAIKNVTVFNQAGVKRVVTACAGCYLTWRIEYPKLLKGSGLTQDFDVVSIYQFLAESGILPDLSRVQGQKISYFAPCHMKVGGDESERTPDVLKKAASEYGITLGDVPFPKCCGGMAASSNPRLAARLSEKVIKAAIDSGVGTVLTSCPFCVENLDRGARRLRSSVKVLHILDLF